MSFLSFTNLPKALSAVRRGQAPRSMNVVYSFSSNHLSGNFGKLSSYLGHPSFISSVMSGFCLVKNVCKWFKISGVIWINPIPYQIHEFCWWYFIIFCNFGIRKYFISTKIDFYQLNSKLEKFRQFTFSPPMTPMSSNDSNTTCFIETLYIL